MLRLSRLPLSRPVTPMHRILFAALAALPISVASHAFGQDAPATPPATAPASPAAPAPAAPAPAAPGGDAAAAPAAPAAATPAVALPENEPLKDSVANFWHYGKIARYDMATAEGQRVLSQNPDPNLLLGMFEVVAESSHDNLDEWMLRWQGVDQMKDVTLQLNAALVRGHEARRADPKYIEENIKLLSANERGYDLAIDRLRDSGELAVPILIDDLRDPSKNDYHPAIRRAFRDLGLSAVNPLLAATEMRDQQTLMDVVSALGDIGYDVAVPYLARLLQSNDTHGDVKAATMDALRRLRVSDPGTLSPATLFCQLSEKFYYDNSAVRADKKQPIGRIFFWNEDRGLTFLAVPQSIFHDVMSRRAAEYSLKLTQGNGPVADAALSLWLAANYQDEAELASGAKDTTLSAESPSAHYWGSLSGTKYLNSALSRAVRDRNAPVAIRIIQSLQDIAGQANILEGTEHPLMDSLQFPDRLVRYEAAFALAAALPRQSFGGEERVVPLLAEALSQTGAPNILIMVPAQDQYNALQAGLTAQGYNVVGGMTPTGAVANASARPTIDAIVTTDEMSDQAISDLQKLAQQTPRLERAVRVIITKTRSSPYVVQAVGDNMLATTQAKMTDLPALKISIDEARARGGSLPLDAASAGKYATRAADLLSKIAINHSPVYDVSMAQPLVLAALDDPRPEIVKDAGIVLGVLDSTEIQPALLQKASADTTPDDLKVAMFKALATNARNFGKHLDDDQITVVQKVVATSPNLDVRTAAGEARGALDLPADQAKKLIIDQARTSN